MYFSNNLTLFPVNNVYLKKHNLWNVIIKQLYICFLLSFKSAVFPTGPTPHQ